MYDTDNPLVKPFTHRFERREGKKLIRQAQDWGGGGGVALR